MPSALPPSYCAQTVRTREPDRYLCALFAPQAVREAWFALFALELELRDIPAKVSEDMIGFIRFAWWREALEEIKAGRTPRHHPVVEALAQAVAVYALPWELLHTLVTAYEKTLLREAFPTAAQVEEHCRETQGTLLRLCAVAAGEGQDAYSEAATGWALTEWARKMDETEAQTAALKKEILKRAAECLRRAAQSHVPRRMLRPFLQAAEFYLRRMHAGKTALSPPVRLMLALRLWLGNR